MRFLNDPGTLFWQAPLSAAIDSHLRSAAARVGTIAATVLRAVDDDELIDQLARELQVVPLKLHRDRMTMRREEIEVDVTGDPHRIPRFDGGKVRIPGVRVTVTVPYDGDAKLWGCQPSTYRFTVPRGRVKAQQDDRGVLELDLELPYDQIEQVKQELTSRLEEIDFFIENQRRDLTGVDERIRREIAQAIATRRARLRKQDGLSELLGIPEIRPQVTESKSTHPLPPSLASSLSPKADAESWDVFVSHASEDKETFVRDLVDRLIQQGIRVWYDEHTLRVGNSLRRSIDKGLAGSKFGIVVVSPAFLSKHWPQKELDGLVALEEDGREIILPVWHNITAAEVRRASPTLADRLAINSSRGVDEVVRELMQVLKPTK